MTNRKYPAISIHPTLHSQLEVNWEQEYLDEFGCPYCETGRLTKFFRVNESTCRLGMRCNSCGKSTCLTNQISGAGRKYSPISTHQTLNSTIKVNWEREYHSEFICPYCNQEQLNEFHHRKSSVCQLSLNCKFCRKYTNLTCPVPIQIRNYRPDVVCPNPLCIQLGPDGQKGWIYWTESRSPCECYFCGIKFNSVSNKPGSWVASQKEDKLLPFCFDNNIWDLRHFYNKPKQRLLSFQTIQPQWYQLQVKTYLHYLLKSGAYSSASFKNIVTILQQFGQVIKQQKIQYPSEITREMILAFLDVCQINKNQTICQKLSVLKRSLEWLELEAAHLVRRHDFPKKSKNDADWLDEVTRTAIKQHLPKIPAPIARQYLVQDYTAARPSDVCQIAFDCLVEENGKLYVKFYQQKVDRWHKLPATREIRRVIESQQKWIRQTFGAEYSYLFCHFRAIRSDSYPAFSNLRPLPVPPKVDATENPMVRIIRLIIEKETIRDSNGQHPHFTGKITRSSRLQEVRVKYGMEAAQLYADHHYSDTTFQHYAPPTREQVAQVDLPFQALLMNPDNRFLPWQSLPESLLKNPKAHELDIEIAPRLVVYGHCALNPKTPVRTTSIPNATAVIVSVLAPVNYLYTNVSTKVNNNG